MNEPILKNNWERFRAHVDLDIETATKLIAPYTQDQVDELVLLSEGCANTNYKIIFKNNPPVVIRIYMRDATALAKELEIHKLVSDKIPVPKHLYVNGKCNLYTYPYAIIEWVDGKLMREVILTKDEKSISECVFEAGIYLNGLRQITFPQGGFFQEKLSIRPFSEEENYLPFVMNLLKDDIVKKSLGSNLLKQVYDLVNSHSSILPNETECNLTHADYDPANILVKKRNGQWKISAVLDWEFAFAGTYLMDIGMMLRYSHKLPSCYESHFIAGIQKSGFQLPKNWKKQEKLLDLICLLNLIHFNPISDRPNLNRDVFSLVMHTVENWESF